MIHIINEHADEEAEKRDHAGPRIESDNKWKTMGPHVPTHESIRGILCAWSARGGRERATDTLSWRTTHREVKNGAFVCCTAHTCARADSSARLLSQVIQKHLQTKSETRPLKIPISERKGEGIGALYYLLFRRISV